MCLNPKNTGQLKLCRILVAEIKILPLFAGCKGHVPGIPQLSLVFKLSRLLFHTRFPNLDKTFVDLYVRRQVAANCRAKGSELVGNLEYLVVNAN